MFDSHCHLDDPRLATIGSVQEILARARNAGVRYVLVPGVGPEQWHRAMQLQLSPQQDPAKSPVPDGVCSAAITPTMTPLQLYPRTTTAWEEFGYPADSELELGQQIPRSEPQLLFAYGIHPQLLPELSDEYVADALGMLRDTFAGLGTAVGECGLDGRSQQIPGGNIERQLEIFTEHLRLASAHEKPVVVHCLRAHDALIAALDRHGELPKGLILHSYSGSAELVCRYMPWNAYFSFAGPVTWQNARKPILAAAAVPLERLLVETDAPDQTPQRYRGGLNQPAYLMEILRTLSEVRGLDLSTLIRLTTDNARRVFGVTA